ncbi:PhzF family phenazine biosynthesis protein [Celerinatantimonas diazotrophica]|uniref:PhzF family phenazine biosynthesis protein n=1 Tax=Celerinatantimonas diazotrophica TaxID=412034 RepID=A0A4R1K1B4_9GAMM|nr:PhzF family phenazine biosynthesis protein [Celerinatantimonas diazotrophica]TCK57786.1 PhzF family phenazine biosynthesis protein [Celerinatantimonas diazotrophica]CAG9298150.1 putative isomerase YddE [Celerinatantimonas diazotrophica]
MGLTIYQVDAFTTEPFTGNPAGVCITPSALDAVLMQRIAQEMAVSETAFLALDTMRLRWFTPQTEVELCGHATLATAYVLKQQGLLSEGDEVVFHTLSGELIACANHAAIELILPAPQLVKTQLSSELLSAVGIETSQLIDSCQFGSKALIVVDEQATLLALSPDFSRLKQLPGRGVVVTAQAKMPRTDFVSRYFAPWIGVDEDPVTGSAHCALAVYWFEQFAKEELLGYQASSRGGYIRVSRASNNAIKLFGQAVIVLKGDLCLPYDE